MIPDDRWRLAAHMRPGHAIYPCGIEPVLAAGPAEITVEPPTPAAPTSGEGWTPTTVHSPACCPGAGRQTVDETHEFLAEAMARFVAAQQQPPIVLPADPKPARRVWWRSWRPFWARPR